MKVGTLMDPNPDRRGRGRGFFFNLVTTEAEPIDDEAPDDETGTLVNSDEPEPDDPDAA